MSYLCSNILKMDQLRFLSLGSGSSGNCYFFGNAFQGILIDAGIGSRLMRKSLKQIGIEMNQILALFVTHDHHDHIKSAGVLSEKFGIPVYTTRKTHDGMDRTYGMTQKLSNANKRYLEHGQSTQVGPFTIESFPLLHDATDHSGYYVQYKHHLISIATDLGCYDAALKDFILKSNIVLLESNYDPDLLETGRYPYPLKMRIKGEKGHLSNQDAGNLLSESYHEDLKYVFLCHLSADNNRPELALQTIHSILEKNGCAESRRLSLATLKRGASELVYFE
jgi:phosphoribosyl 1,2-cyclic phosphodiesterase